METNQLTILRRITELTEKLGGLDAFHCKKCGWL
jgi:hypothetical protein